jgi:uncharacterized membrane protein
VTRGQRFLAAFLVGFGIWNVVDLLVFHWLLEVHHIRVDAAEPLLRDLGWFAVFGLVPLGIGWTTLRKAARH